MNLILKCNKLLRCSLFFRPSYKFYSTNSKTDPKINKKWLIITTGIGSLFFGYACYLRKESEKLYENIDEKLNSFRKTTGKANIGGEFHLVNHNGMPVNRNDLKNKWLLIYFGYCHCPDICPEQLEKMMAVVDKIDKNPKIPNLFPVFVSLDPERDTSDNVAKYISEFSSKMIGLTGSKEEIEKMAKLYQVFFKFGPKDVEGDYLVDHAIIMYFINPEGEFVQYFGTAKAIDEIYAAIVSEMKKYEQN